MGMDSQTVPPIPDLATVAETIRLAAAAEAERHEQRPPEGPECRCDDLDELFRPTPARDALNAFLRGLPDETVAGLYALYHLGDRAYPTRAEAMGRYRHSYDIAMEPRNRPYGAQDLAAKGPLAYGLRRGLEHLGLRLEPGPADTSSDDSSRTS